ncbi:hypothetical protein GCM10023185_44610 [Hymenobacter saemangeumensis]|uniref:DUF4890 domain-containing protein n=1 Tax=Hymenobacter saemangeumensis TaxID=1084522 RepID=A0ABP8IT19_9BACT
MKKVLTLLAVLALASTTTSFAQAGKTPAASEKAAAHSTPDYSSQLGLNAAQATKLQTILQGQSQEMQQLKSKDPAGTGSDAMAARARHDEQLRAVLTPEQFAKYKKLSSK